jgi:hypothetical protein
MSTVNIAGLDKAELFAALYNHAKPLGMGFLHYDPTPLTKEAAQSLMEAGDDSSRMFPGMRSGRSLYFDYVKGRPLKIDLSGDEMDTYLYNRDQGNDAAERIVAELRAKQ